MGSKWTLGKLVGEGGDWVPSCYLGKERLKYTKPQLPVVLYECETWSVTLREENRLRVFENRVLRGIFGRRRDEVTGKWRKMHNGDLHNLCSFPNITRQIKSKRMRWAGHVACRREDRKCTWFGWERSKERDHSKDRGVNGEWD
jgi:hypothetical protein